MDPLFLVGKIIVRKIIFENLRITMLALITYNYYILA